MKLTTAKSEAGTAVQEPLVALFALDEEVAGLELGLGSVGVGKRLAVLIPLAWHLRQRNCARALELADEAEALLRVEAPGTAAHDLATGRLQLARAEIKIRGADLDAATALANAALAHFESLGEPIGAGDAHWLLASIGVERGNREHVNTHLTAALSDYRAAGDALRIDATLARTLAFTAFNDAAQTAAGLAELFPESVPRHDAISTLVAIAHANVAALTNDPGAAIKNDIRAHHTARATGQIREAIVCAINAAEGFANLGDLDAALEWSERALAMARTTGWPASIGVCLMQIGDVLRQLARHDEARAFLQEAHQLIMAVPGSRNEGLVLKTLGLLALDVGDDAEALRIFLQLEHGLSEHSDPDLLMEAARGQATALSRLGRPEEAHAKATQALGLASAKGNSDGQVRALEVLAELHHAHSLPAPEDMNAPTPALHYLNQALKITETISGYVLPVDVLYQIAVAYAACDDYKAAYQYSLAATSARNRSSMKEAQSRALAMQIRQEVDRARADSEHHRKLAITLRDTNETLETLGLIGREITASLDANAVFEALLRHVNRLLDATSFSIFLLEPDGGSLVRAFGFENGQPLAATQIEIDHPTKLSARCARERREFVIDNPAGEHDLKAMPGTLQTRSLLFAPLEVGTRLLGVITIQSPRVQAYGERERSIFRTLCAYGAIALDNAAAYGAVEAARQQSAKQEQELRIAATAFESQEGLFITDSERFILRTNTAFTRITGYQAEEVVGQRPIMFKSPSHDEDFYVAVKDALADAGTWQGEIWIRHKQGHVFPLWLSVTTVRSTAGEVTNHVFSLVDITERKLAEDEIRNLAFYDALTNLPNRRLLMDRLRHALATSARNGLDGALVFIDLDNFKKLNDTRGHDVGDLLLQNVAQRISACLRDGDTAARLGGDEFVVLLEGLSNQALESAAKAETVAEKILSTLNQPYLLVNQEHHSTPSIGVCLFRGQNEPVEDLLKQADLAMYQAKAAGRNAVRFFDPDMQASVSAHAALEADLRQAVANRQFELHYQPQVDAAGRVVGAEALLRWHHPERGMVSPAQFIPLAEETGLILPIGKWVLETVCAQLARWASRPDLARVAVAVNVSARQFHQADFVEEVVAVITDSGVNAQCLKLELTESLLVHDVETIIEKMSALRPHGVSFSLDDFGTGYSSLSYLKRLPLDQLKIDQSFVRDVLSDPNDAAIASTIVALAHSLGLDVIAEGVETEAQRDFLARSGCNVYQGYLFSRPLPLDKFEQFVGSVTNDSHLSPTPISPRS